MAQPELDVDFNPSEFVVPSNWLIDNSFWEHINENCTVPSSPSCKARFYVPTVRAQKGWPEKLRQHFGVEPWVIYDPAVLNLPNEITAEEIEACRLNINKYVIKSLEDPTPVGPPEKLSVQRYLEHESTSILARLSFGGKWENLTEKQRRISRWRADYGFLWDHRDGAGVLFPGPKDEKALKFEVLNEYFFHLKQFPQLILSVGQEPNTDRAIFGFRREASLDWPFDRVQVGFEYDSQGKITGPKCATLPDRMVENGIVGPMNSLIANLEYFIQK